MEGILKHHFQNRHLSPLKASIISLLKDTETQMTVINKITIFTHLVQVQWLKQKTNNNKRSKMEGADVDKQDIGIKIKPDNILFFDMDGTLVDTDYANYLSYKKAIESVIQTNINIHFCPNERFNSDFLQRLIPNLTEAELKKIIQIKEKNYKEHLSQTKLNKSVTDLLIQYSETNKTVLVTKCSEDRAMMTLNYHGLVDKFSDFFFRQARDKNIKTNKYQNAILCLGISPKLVIAFENEEREIADAIKVGIKNINPFK